jgi:DnaJ-class molecular chaperone
MPTTKDFYEILGVPRGASAEEIKAAYKRLAKLHHPDMAQPSQKKTAEERFKEINEAYQILSNPEKRRLYDQLGHAAFAPGGGGGPFGWGFQTGQWGPFTYTYSTEGARGFDFADFEDPLDIFESVFGFRDFRERPRKGRSLYYSLTIDFLEAARGLEKEIKMGGQNLKIRIPRGVNDGTELRFAGEGEPGPAGAPPGDLYLTIKVRPHPLFARFGDDLYVAQEISFAQAVLGDVLEIPVLSPEAPNGEGQLKLRLPPGTQPGTDFRLRGYGMPRLHGGGRGDAYVRVFIKIPKKISREEKELLEKLKGL